MSPNSQVGANLHLELTALIYDAVSDSSRWPAFLALFVAAIGARRGTLLIQDTSGTFAVCWHGWSDEQMDVYRRRFAAEDPWAIASRNWPEGAVGTDYDLCPREVMESSVAFREFYAANDAIHGIGAAILAGSGGHSFIAATRGAAVGPFGESEKAIVRPLMPHLKRAALLHGELGFLRRQLAMFTGHLDRYPHAFLLLDSDGRVLYSNAMAREATARRDGLAIENDCVSLTRPRQHKEFRRAIVSVCTARGASMQRFEVSRPSGKQPYRLILMPVADSGVIPLGVSMPAVSVLILDVESRPKLDASLLCELFSLTPAEARVGLELASGYSVEEIAAESRVSLETVRTHIKRILSKTGTNRQGELISLILRSIPAQRS